MALKVRIRLLSIARISMALISLSHLLLVVQFAYAGEAQTTSAVNNLLFQVIVILSGLLCTIWTGIGVWLITNQKEIFQRLGHVEKLEAIRDEVCDERHKSKNQG